MNKAKQKVDGMISRYRYIYSIYANEIPALKNRIPRLQPLTGKKGNRPSLDTHASPTSHRIIRKPALCSQILPEKSHRYVVLLGIILQKKKKKTYERRKRG